MKIKITLIISMILTYALLISTAYFNTKYVNSFTGGTAMAYLMGPAMSYGLIIAFLYSYTKIKLLFTSVVSILTILMNSVFFYCIIRILEVNVGNISIVFACLVFAVSLYLPSFAIFFISSKILRGQQNKPQKIKEETA